mmetsp:Transcript_25126/g.41864  ORF Transcript_25126/g.41864 Transcript_25126/m.41864 type:complete len:313 (+) Transcript_25126:67-1005(+)
MRSFGRFTQHSIQQMRCCNSNITLQIRNSIRYSGGTISPQQVNYVRNYFVWKHIETCAASSGFLLNSTNWLGMQHPRYHAKNGSSAFEKRSLSSSSDGRRGSPDPYDLLNVPRNATAKEIKVAYFREAKKFHPDLNPNDPKAKEKFQQVAAAYELLSDEKRRRMYDATGYTQEPSYDQSVNAEDVFNAVREDFDVVKDALSMYRDEVYEEMDYAMDCIKRQDWDALYGLAMHHKVLIASVVIPTIIFLRYPPAAIFALRAVWALSYVGFVGLMRSGNVTLAARLLWANIVKLSREQAQRAKVRKSERNRRKQ